MQSPIRAMAELGQNFYIAVAEHATGARHAGGAGGDGRGDLPRPGPGHAHPYAHDRSFRRRDRARQTGCAGWFRCCAFLACTLPMMELLTLVGGVDPAVALEWFSSSRVGVAVLGCSLAMLFSLWVGKTHEALLATYAVWIFWLLAAADARALSWSFGLPILTPPPGRSRSFWFVLRTGIPIWCDWTNYARFSGSDLRDLGGLGRAGDRAAAACLHAREREEAFAAGDGRSRAQLLEAPVAEGSLADAVARPQPGDLARMDRSSTVALGDGDRRDLRCSFAVLQHSSPCAGLGQSHCDSRQRLSSGDRPVLVLGHGGDVAG